ncbi:MAG TPA: hypothetical protein VJ849_12150, partial [Actinomycetes bacterium]|nr:hypothetical protein [Actinomycetes bacterium]
VETDAARTSARNDAHEGNNAVARVKKAFRLKPPFVPISFVEATHRFSPSRPRKACAPSG